MQQALLALLDVLNACRYLPKAVVFHIDESDLGVTPIHYFKYAVVQFCNTAKLLLNTVQPYKQSHIGMFVSLCSPTALVHGLETASQQHKKLELDLMDL